MAQAGISLVWQGRSRQWGPHPPGYVGQPSAHWLERGCLRTEPAQRMEKLRGWRDVPDSQQTVNLTNKGCVWVFSCSVRSDSWWPHGPPGSSVYEIPQARILEWVAISFSRGSSRYRDWTHVSCIASGFFTAKLAGVKAEYGIIAPPTGCSPISLSLLFFFFSFFSIHPSICLSPPLAHPTLFKSPYSLKQNYIEIRPVSNPTMSSKHSREKDFMCL